MNLVDSLIQKWVTWRTQPSRAELEVEIRRLTQKCRERGDENAALQAQLEALRMQIVQAQADYREVKREVPSRILEGKRADAVHEARIEYENNLMRVLISGVHRECTGILNMVARLNKDLGKAKNAVVGGMVGEEMTTDSSRYTP